MCNICKEYETRWVDVSRSHANRRLFVLRTTVHICFKNHFLWVKVSFPYLAVVVCLWYSGTYTYTYTSSLSTTTIKRINVRRHPETETYVDICVFENATLRTLCVATSGYGITRVSFHKPKTTPKVIKQNKEEILSLPHIFSSRAPTTLSPSILTEDIWNM